jgi:hypothetical protein
LQAEVAVVVALQVVAVLVVIEQHFQVPVVMLVPFLFQYKHTLLQ